MTMKDFAHIPIVRTKALAGLVATGALVTLLTGCGGGSSSGASSDSPGTTRSGMTAEQARHEQVAAAAQNTPNAGGVTQSSNAAAGVTTDQVTVTAEYDEGGQIRYQVANRQEWSVDSNSDTVLARGGGEVWNGTELRKKLADGTLYVDVYTNIEAPKQVTAGSGTAQSMPDADYLSGGLWVYVPDDATSVADFEFGGFADGSDPFDQSDLAGLTGTATYEGDATGVFSDSTTNVNSFFDADTTLTAEFGNGSDLGSISGRVHSFTEDDIPVEGNPVVMLGSADIGSTDSGFFTGETSGTYEGESYTGQWGGQFYGNSNASGQPGSVAGTFGGATADSSKAVLGVYGADRQ